MKSTQKNLPFSLALCAAACLAGTGPAQGDEQLRRFETPAELVRDRDLNRIIRRVSAGGAATASSQANVIAVTQSGRGNTVVLSVEQRNTGSVSAAAALNGSLTLD